MTAPEIVRLVREQLPALTGYNIDSISRLAHDDKGWAVSVEVIEMRRVPNSGDVLATYDVRLDDAGNLIGYERTHRYERSQLEAV